MACPLASWQLKQAGDKACRFCGQPPAAHAVRVDSPPASTSEEHVAEQCMMLGRQDADSRGKTLEKIVGWALIESFTCKVSGS